ncbi:MAG: phosphoribosylformylglycinamidine synthase [Clostridia bacterium]
MNKFRVYVEKKAEFNVEAEMLKKELNENLSLNIADLRLINTYDVFNIQQELLEKAAKSVFGEIVTDVVTFDLDLTGLTYFAVEFLPGQFDQRATAAKECIELIDSTAQVKVRSGKIIVLQNVNDSDIVKIKKFYINAIESREKDLSILSDSENVDVEKVKIVKGFISLPFAEIKKMRDNMSLAMTDLDLAFVQEYFKNTEKRDPVETEIRMLDTYWSDHCRHTTFETELTSIEVEDGVLKNAIDSALDTYMAMRKNLNRENKEITLMDLATIAGKYLKKTGYLNDLEVSEENNACSVYADILVDGKKQKYLIQFKNETHNHPTEIEPFGGASTCIGGAIRDPLSGRAYVYQAMRVTGAGDVWKSVADTLPNKLPQRVISKKACNGYSSYGNQIGLATTYVKEIYHEGFTAKRMEVGACLGAVKAENVRRESVSVGDIVIMFGGRTGRDGIGGATGSSKEHNEASLEVCASEVQKGNAPEERKIQHLMRRPEVTKLIKKSNDFGAGGVSVAVGELADSLLIDLNQVRTKYSGLNATEIAISESQERMSVVVEKKDVDEFLKYCEEENLESYKVADITDTGRLQMIYNGELVVDLSREFINTNGVRQKQAVVIGGGKICNPFERIQSGNLKNDVEKLLSCDNVLTQKGLVEIFDATIGNTTVLMPYGGKYQLTETQCSCQKVSVLDGYTDDATIMSYGYDPDLSSVSPFLGSQYAVLDSVAKAIAIGGKFEKLHFSFQEYFERLGNDENKWGKPLQSLLGAIYMQDGLKKAAIGGKDSMSGTFKDITVPPTLISFAETMTDANLVISPELKAGGDNLYFVKLQANDNFTVNTEKAKEIFAYVESLIENKKLKSAYAVGFGGVVEAISKMSFGNKVGANISLDENELFAKNYGSFILETEEKLDSNLATLIGKTEIKKVVTINGVDFEIDKLIETNFKRFTKIYKDKTAASFDKVIEKQVEREVSKYPFPKKDVVKVFIPVFPGTNCDYDTARAFEKEGAVVTKFVFNNLTGENIRKSIETITKEIDNADILAFAGGFSSGDEPDGSGKFIANVILNENVKGAIERLLARKGLVLGICNGFQALVKSGLLPYGKFGCLNQDSPTLFRNDINRHVSLITKTKVAGTNSPWLKGFKYGDLHEIALSHGEGKFVVNEKMAKELFDNGQVCFQYADLDGKATMESPHNPNGSYYAIEGITSFDGLVLGKMGHSERYENNIYKNITGNKHQNIFKNAVEYFVK